ncbi:GPW / gp25 family protein [Aureimonas ureilytica]|uniref:GPW / gp25 family protein n=1 Tax=Aureimonas ureilytica TaxID=401562 RepID=A0A175R6A3_9HYPH|nr:GPW/gp25 family protein [Aureimonas ureilytica]KTQ95009.1 GPW / gp25 family protein [Aureimonas ureilytica]
MDFDRRTGARLSNYESALQSVDILFCSRIGSHVLLREFGAGLVELLGRKLNARLFSAFMLVMAAAIDLWEPRFRVRRITPGGTVDELRRGSAKFSIEVEFRPRAHLGDPSIEGIRTFGIRFGRTAGVTE